MCDCYKDVDAQLAAQNTKLIPAILWRKGELGVRFKIATEKIDSRKRSGPVTIVGSYCPFCGAYLEDPEDGNDV